MTPEEIRAEVHAIEAVLVCSKCGAQGLYIKMVMIDGELTEVARCPNCKYEEQI